MKSSLLYQFVDYINWLMLIVGFLTLKSLRYHKVAYYFWFLLMTAVIDFVVSHYFRDNSGFSTRLWYTLLRPIEYVIYVKLFLSRDTEWTRYFRSISVLIMGGFSFYTILFRLSHFDAAASVMIIQKIFILITLFIYFRQLLENDDILSLSQVPLFWLATGLFFFAAGNIVATGFYHQIYAVSKPVAFALYKLNFILGIFSYLTNAYCFYLYYKKEKSEKWKTH